MDVLIADGNRNNLGRLQSYESHFDEGDTGKISLNCITSYGLGEVRNLLSTALKRANVNMPAPVKVSGKKILITFKKGFPFLAIILAAIIGISVLYIIIKNWELVKQVAPTVLSAANKILPYLPYIVVGVVGIVIVSKTKSLLT